MNSDIDSSMVIFEPTYPVVPQANAVGWTRNNTSVQTSIVSIVVSESPALKGAGSSEAIKNQKSVIKNEENLLVNKQGEASGEQTLRRV